MTAKRPTAAESDYYTVSQAAARLGVSRITIWRWIRDGHLPAMRLGPRTTRIKREDLERALARMEESSARPWLSETGTGSGGSPQPSSPFLVGPHAAAHSVQFYEDDATLIDVVADFIGTGLSSGDTAIVLATPSHRSGVEERLREWGLDLDAAVAGGRYTAPDVAEALSRFMVDGTPNAERYAATVSAIQTDLCQTRPVRLFGEMVGLLAAQGNSTAAVRLERLGNELPRRLPVSRLCAYHIGDFGTAAAGALSDICSAHDVVIPAERFAPHLTERDRSHAIVALQQRVHWLEAQLEAQQRMIYDLRLELEAEHAADRKTVAAPRQRHEDVSVVEQE